MAKSEIRQKTLLRCATKGWQLVADSEQFNCGFRIVDFGFRQRDGGQVNKNEIATAD